MARLVETTRRDDLLVVALRPPAAPADPVQSWLVEAPAELLGALRSRLADGDAPPRVTLLLHGPDASGDGTAEAVADGLAGALRGIAQSLARELAPATRVNALLAGSDDAAARDALAFLGGADGGFVTGATVDLRVAS